MIEITVDTRRATVTNRELLTSGSYGIGVQFTLSDDWAGLVKTACFRNGDDSETQIDIAMGSSVMCYLPTETCDEKYIDETVYAGIYGTDGNGNLIIPTIWVSIGALRQGVKPGYAEGPAPTPDMWAQIQAIAMSAGEENAEAAAQSAEAASGSADDAAASATESAGYATAASESADTASGYAEAAGSSASDAADSATAAAVSAGDASTAQTAAETAQTAAETAQSLAETAQAAAEAAQAFLENASATATTLEPGSSATASYEDGVFTFGIPEGLKGDKGDTGATGQTGAQGPKGDKGDPGDPATNIVTSVNTQIGDVVLDAGDIGYESTTVEDELTTINSALTSLSAVTEIIDTASGAIASFPDGAGTPMRSLLAQIEPQQDLHGYDAPWAGGSGKNLLNLDFTNDSETVAGMTFTHGESYITLKGTASGTSYATFNLRTPIPADMNTDYTYSLTISGTCPGGLYGIEFNNGTTLVQRFRCNTTDATSKTLQISSAFDNVTFKIEGLTSGLVFDCEIKIQFEKGSSKTTWQTYSNICPISGWTGLSGWVEEEYDPTEQPTFTVTWQTEAGTVYGGTVDVVTGVLTADMGIKTELWKNFTSEATVDTNLIRRQANISSAKGDTENAQKTISNIAPFVRTIADKSVHVSMASSGNYLYAILPLTTDPDLEITFCYPLATPQTYQLTPQQISTLLGNNTVFVDCGAVSVTYQASIKGYIDKILAS